MDPFLGEIIMFAGNFPPRGWAFCGGQLLPINSNQALYSLLGTTYGGDGRTTFALPDLRGRAPVHAGHGPGLSSRPLGQRGGQPTVTLNYTQIPAHNHLINAVNTVGNSTSPTNHILGDSGAFDTEFSSATPNTMMSSRMVNNTGGNQAHENMQPFLALNYIIALQGVFPSRT